MTKEKENNNKTLTISFENHHFLCNLKLSMQERTKGKIRIDFDEVIGYLKDQHDPTKLDTYCFKLRARKKVL